MLVLLLYFVLSIKQQVNSVESTCFYHLRRLKQIKRYIITDAVKHLVAAVIIGRLDYCNSVLAGLQWSTIAPLQRVQNAAARLVLGLSPCDYDSSVRHSFELHWLPIHYRIQFKLALLMYMAHIGQSAAYIIDAVTPVNQEPSRSRLRYGATTDFIIPRTRTKIGETLFSVFGWNSL